MRLFQSRTSLITAVFLFSLAVYSTTLPNGFVYDDNTVVLKNSWMKDVRNVPDIFFSPVWSFDEDYASSDYYRPMQHIIYMAEYSIFGLRPWGWHLTNTLIHALNSVMVFLTASILLGAEDGRGRPVSPEGYLFPFIASLLFASHPVNTEPVAWIACVTEVSYAFFFLLSLYLYILYSSSKAGKAGRHLYILSVVSFFTATLFKEPALLLPVILAAYDYSRGELRSSLKKYIPYLGADLLYIALRSHSMSGVVSRKVYMPDPLMQLLNIFPVFREYIHKLFFPLDLSIFNVIKPVATVADPGLILSVAVTALFLFLIRRAWKVKHPMLVAGLLMAVPLLPTFYLLFQNTDVYYVAVLADRYLYLPVAGFSILVAFSFGSFYRRLAPQGAKAVLLGALILAGLYTTGTVKRNFVWHDDYTLWKKTVEDYPDNYFAHFFLGDVYLKSGQKEKAVGEFMESMRLRSSFTGNHHSLGLIYYSEGRTDDAEREFREVLAVQPENNDALYNIALVHMDKGEWTKAVEELKRALKYARGRKVLRIRNALAVSYAKLGRLEDTRGELMQAIKADPNDTETLENLKSIERISR